MAGVARYAGPLSPEARALASDPSHVAVARHLAWKFSRRAPWLRDDLVSAALEGLCEAARSFDPARGIRFWTHARLRVRGAILDEMRGSGVVRATRPGASRPAIDSLDLAAPGEPDTPGSRLESGECPVGWEAEWEDRLRGLVRGLPAKHRGVILTLYGDCRATTMREAGAILGIGQVRVSQVANEALAMIRQDEEYRRSKEAS